MSFLNFHHLRYFRAIAQDGTLTGASQSLGISQSAVSVQLRQLEDSLGQALFLREKKSGKTGGGQRPEGVRPIF